MNNVLVIIPSYNETKLQHVVDQVLAKGYRVLVVDDGSTTLDLNENEDIFVCRHKVNLGQGAALQTGFILARKLQPTYVVTMDADGQHDVDDITTLLKTIAHQKVDIVFGNRLKTKEIPLLRRIILRIGILFNWLYTGIKLNDAHNGLRLLSQKAYTTINLHQADMAHATEILDQVKTHQLTYAEAPVHIRYTDYSIRKGQRNSNALSIVKNLIFSRL